MGFTLTPNENGEYSIEGSYESPRGQSVTYVARNEETGEQQDQFLFGNEADVDTEAVEFGDPDALERNQQYLEAFVELNPQLPNAVQWAANGWDQDLAQQFNTSLDNEDWETLNALTEKLMTAYNEAGSVEPTDGDDTDGDDIAALAAELDMEGQLERMDDSSKADLTTLKDYVFNHEADPDIAGEQMELAEECYANSDYDGAVIAGLSAQYHAGNMDVKQAVSQAVKQLGLKGAVDAYSRLALGYSATGNDMTYGYETNDY